MNPTTFCSRTSAPFILFCREWMNESVMQQSASNNQLCNLTWQKPSILRATLPSAGERRHCTKKAGRQSFMTPCFSAAACSLSLFTITQLLLGIHPEEVRYNSMSIKSTPLFAPVICSGYKIAPIKSLFQPSRPVCDDGNLYSEVLHLEVMRILWHVTD